MLRLGPRLRNASRSIAWITGVTLAAHLSLPAQITWSSTNHGVGTAPRDVVVRDLTVTGSGLTLATEDSGIYVTEDGDRARIEGNHLADNLIGVYLKGPNDAVVAGNTIDGRTDLRMNERGNGVQLWNTPGSVVQGNTIRHGRDGIFVTTSRSNKK